MKVKYFIMLIYALFFILLLVSCASNGKVKILTNPEGVSVARISNGESQVIGKTPFDVNSSELFENGSPIEHLILSKEGFEEKTIVITESRLGENYDISVKMNPIQISSLGEDSALKQEKLAIGIAKANGLISKKRLDEAQIVLNGLIQEFDKVSVCHDLLGNIYYLKRDLKQAYFHYKKSLQLNPDKIETQQIVQKLKTIIN